MAGHPPVFHHHIEAAVIKLRQEYSLRIINALLFQAASQPLLIMTNLFQLMFARHAVLHHNDRRHL